MNYCFDIDGTICTNTNGDYEKAEPLTDRINIERVNIPRKTISERYLFGYPPRKQITNTNKNKIAAVEKFAGNINATTTKTGIQRGKIDFENEKNSSLH